MGGRAESDAYEPTMHKHRCAKKLADFADVLSQSSYLAITVPEIPSPFREGVLIKTIPHVAYGH